MDDFSNRVALVTGAARGQGRAHAIAFAERGADVVVCDRCADSPAIAYPMGTEEDLAETVRLVEATGRRCIAVKADTADRAAMEALVARAENELGRVDVAVANAGVSGTSPITEASAAVWEEVIGSNLTGVYNTLAAVAPGMIARGYGRIVTISSMLGRSAAQGQAAYGASKWGVIGMTKSVALDLAAHGITVNAIAPGNISTPMVHNDALYSVVRPDLDAPTRADVEPVMAMLHAQPIAFLEPEEVTRAVLFFAAEASAHITGTVLPVDAGAAARVSS
ncbi:mycofactocin-coupled SDR family oxidoreductase [Gordonia sp. PS3]|uniref:3-oxoacyl-[acyl-carrier-protein] reductase MabA n=1 Tax=Gordonia sihwensis NBRC 108236 TaxID=1223544 RepID=L7LG53_9ACTN|nr:MULTISPECIES: mycofactocin-coupled SDR family oxidoreductase [Gordonia]AUH68981.1 NAD(P)-dependent oxidoreductase [Gordonia sp. YC-JH1]KXT56063.1 3-ketoacyl-ACP reductase [Gordonia sp. QH-12]GAC59721.1 putative oxidoreductase [Gordonia sihwensis NBRC 108236]